MLPYSMTTKQILSLFKKNQNLCEITKEYPSLEQSSMPRHLCTFTKPIKTLEHVHQDKLSAAVTTEDHEKDAKKPPKTEKDETELIELFQYEQENEINNKLYKKRRYQWTTLDDNEEKRDNTT